MSSSTGECEVTRRAKSRASLLGGQVWDAEARARQGFFPPTISKKSALKPLSVFISLQICFLLRCTCLPPHVLENNCKLVPAHAVLTVQTCLYVPRYTSTDDCKRLPMYLEMFTCSQMIARPLLPLKILISIPPLHKGGLGIGCLYSAAPLKLKLQCDPLTCKFWKWFSLFLSNL